MMISTKGRYALRVMIDLATANAGEYISLKSVAGRQEISEKYMESIISLLVKNDFVEGMRGKGGGYRLTRAPEEYSIGSILRITEGTLAPVACLEKTPNKCERSEECKTLRVWKKLDEIISGYLDNLTLSDVAFSDEAE